MTWGCGKSKEKTMSERYIVSVFGNETVWYNEDDGEIIAKTYLQGNTWKAVHVYSGRMIGEFIDQYSANKAVDVYKVKAYKI